MGRNGYAWMLALLALGGIATADARVSPAFPEGTNSWTLSAAFTAERTGEDVNLSSIHVGRDWFLLDNISIGLQGSGCWAHDQDSSPGAGLAVLGRWHFLDLGALTLYGDALGGVLGTGQDFPTDGTEINFTYAGGLGVAYRLRCNLYLMGGARFQHISNAFIEGRDHNPVLNSYGGYLGLMWTFR